MNISEHQQLANIDSLRSYVDSAYTLGIKQKGDLVKDLNNKKEELISSVSRTLADCKKSERVWYNRWINTDSKEAHDKLEEYNRELKDQHDEGCLLYTSPSPRDRS